MKRTNIIIVALIVLSMMLFGGCKATGTSNVNDNTKHVHKYSIFVKTIEATDTEQGYDLYKCSCGATTKANYTPKISSDGNALENTSNVNDNTKHVHKYSIFVKTIEPTDTEQGYDLYKCSCGATTKANYTPKNSK